ncbi:MAG: prephenate dehydratase [Actinobacteria bacterium]|nr:prephenate dehydratase [Actinomycetota bacterium]
MELRVAYQGEPGAYSEDAVRRAFPGSTPLPCETVREAFAAVEEGRAGAGVVPVENSAAGSINETHEALLASDRLRILGELVLPVDHALLAPAGATLEGVRRVYSHPQALAQCDEFLLRLGAEIVPVHDTAGAARMVAERGVVEEAAVAGERAAEMLGLAVLARRIQTEEGNATKFAVIGDPEAGPVLGEPSRTSIVFATADEPGSLLRCLQPFADHGVNLSKLESRPRRGAPFAYVFYADLDGSAGDPGVAAALEDLRARSPMLKVLGSYPLL